MADMLAKWSALMLEKPPNPKGKPEPTVIAALKEHKAKEKAFKARLSDTEMVALKQHTNATKLNSGTVATNPPRTGAAPKPKQRAATAASIAAAAAAREPAAAAEEPAPAAEEPAAGAAPIYLMAGQSNMVGRGDPGILPDELVDRVRKSGAEIMFDLERHRPAGWGGNPGCPDEAHASDGWVKLEPGCQVHPLGGRHFGPEWGYADQFLREGVERPRFVKYGMGSSSVVMARGVEPEWLPEGEHVTRLIEMAKAACASEGRDVYLAGLFWNQGNSDVNVKPGDGTAQLYTDRLVQLVTRLRRELAGLHRGLPVVARHVCKGSKRKTPAKVNQAMDAAFGQLGHAQCLRLFPEDGATLPDTVVLLEDDIFHFDGTTLLSLGKEAAEAMPKT